MMNPNLLDMAKGYLSSDVIKKSGAHLGESPESTQKGLSAAIPTVMAFLVRQASSDPTGGSVTRILGEAQRDGETGEDLPSSMAGGSKTDALIAKSQGVLGSAFGDRLPAAVDHVAASSGVSKGSAGKLLALAAPIVMAVVGREATARKLGPAGIASMLIGQKGAVASALGGGGLTSIFGGGADWTKPGELGAGAQAGAGGRIAAAERVGDTRRYETRPLEGRPAGRRIGLPLILLGALALLGILMLVRRDKPRLTMPEAPRVPRTEMPEAPRVQTPPAPQAPAVPPPTVGQAPTPAVPPAIGGGPSAAASELNRVFANTTEALPQRVPLDGLNFGTDSAQLSPSQFGELDEVADALKKHPTAKVQVEAFTDDRGDLGYNEKLSADRANAVRDALIRKGVDPSQISIAGKGASGAIAPNETEEGRATNRRVDLVVTDR